MRLNFRLMVVAALITVMATAGFALPAAAQGQEKTPEINITAPSAVLMDAVSGQVLWEKNAHERRSPASITKVMTLLVAFEALEKGRVKLTDEVVTSEDAAKMTGSIVFLDVGERISFEELLMSVAVASGNDASVAVAEHVAGSEEQFVELMNKKAQELGLKNTQFKNSHGLDQEGHYTSAYDVAVMTKEAAKYTKLLEYASIWMRDLTVKRVKPFTLVNTNKLISWYDGADGLKTGHTDKAGFCVAATAKRGSTRMVAVIMGSESSDVRFREAAKLMNMGFANYTSIPVGEKGETVADARIYAGHKERIPVVLADDFGVTVRRGEEQKLTREVNLQKNVVAPVNRGQKLGEIVVKRDGQVIGKVDLVSAAEVRRAGFFRLFWTVFKKLVGLGR